MTKTRIAWPAALGIFRERMPEFICRAALASITPEPHRKVRRDP